MALPEPHNHQDRLLCVHTADVEPVDVSAVLPGIKVWPLFLDSENGIWVLRVQFAPGTELPMHFHTGTVHFYQLSGSWNYKEYPEDILKADSYLYEPGGSIHTFHVPTDAKVPADGFMMVQGANVNFTPEGEYINIMDAGWIEHVILECCKAQGKPTPRYIKPMAKAGFSA
jgi:quercetin dioxygenase-like cupin family protein